jgi:small subunit ribosomal protein S11
MATTAQKKKVTTTKEAPAKKTKSFDSGRVYINVSFNNTIITITDPNGNVVAWASAGSLGFAGPKKATPFASQKVVATIAEKIAKSGPFNVDVIVSGVSVGRDSAIRSLVNHGFVINSIKDVTPIPHNGPKPKKVRRV